MPSQHHKQYWQVPTPSHSIIFIPVNKWLLCRHLFWYSRLVYYQLEMVNRDTMWGLSKIPLQPSVNKIIHQTAKIYKPPRSDRPGPGGGGENKDDTNRKYDTHAVYQLKGKNRCFFCEVIQKHGISPKDVKNPILTTCMRNAPSTFSQANVWTAESVYEPNPILLQAVPEKKASWYFERSASRGKTTTRNPTPRIFSKGVGACFCTVSPPPPPNQPPTHHPKIPPIKSPTQPSL